MTVKVRFSVNRIREFSCPKNKQQSFLWDSVSPGLGLRVTQNGKPSYIFQSRYLGKTLRITIGNPNIWSIPQAQEKAREYQRLIDQGIDPRQQLRLQKKKTVVQQEQSQLEATPFHVVWERYLSERRQFWSARHYQDHIVMTSKGKRGRNGVLFQLLNLPLISIDAKRVESLMEREASARPARARLALRQLRAFLRWAAENEEWSAIVNEKAASSRRARELGGKARPRTDHLEREQLAPWFDACLKYSNPIISAYLQCLLLTGARREELGLLRWEDVDFNWRALTIRDKNDGNRSIPLTPYVSELIQSLPKENQWVFSSLSSESGRLVEPRLANNVIAKRIDVQLTLHGLRRSFKSLSEWVEVPVGVVAQIMGHKPSATVEKHYTIRPLDLLRIHHERIESWILSEARIFPQSIKPNRQSKTELLAIA